MTCKKLIVLALLTTSVLPMGSVAQQNSDALEITAAVTDPFDALIEDTPLFLSVKINGEDTGLVAEFLAHPKENRISIDRAELAEIGVKAPTLVKGVIFRRVYLDSIPGLQFRYDANAQEIILNAPNSALLPTIKSAAFRPDYLEAEKSTGLVLNYTLGADFGSNGANGGFGFNALSAGMDAWVFSPFGTLSNTAVARYTEGVNGGTSAQRFETRYDVSFAKKALTFSIGDIKTSGPTWARPIRMGGVQLRRDFGLRNDLVTEQLLSFSGAAAVPSTVDVFIENNRAFSTNVGKGPFRIEDLPSFSGSGDAVIVVRDELGRAQKREVSFFATQNLLKKGTADYSLEFGLARQAYGVESNNYGDDVIYSGSFRYGLRENLTFEAHVEGKDDLKMASLGVNVVPFSFAEVSFTGGISDYQNTKAGFANATFRRSFGKFDVNVSVTRAEDGFADLAYATGVDFLGLGDVSGGSLLEFPTALDVISVAVPLLNTDRKLGVSLVHSKRPNSKDMLLSTSFGKPIRSGKGALNVSASHNFETGEATAALSLSMSLGNRTYARANIGRDYKGDRTATVFVGRPIGEKITDYGYGVQVEEYRGNVVASASGDYRSRYGKAGIEVQTGTTGTFARGSFEGAIVMAGGTIAAGNTINDSFALVDLGVADVPVYLQNRKVSRTNGRGRALVPGLSSHRRNRVSINVNELDEKATVGVTAMDVVPARRSGLLVDFNGSARPNVLVVMRFPDGEYLPAGTYGYLNGRSEETYVGYDGQAWLEDVKGRNTMQFDTPRGPCTASFAFEETLATQDLIDPVICK